MFRRIQITSFKIRLLHKILQKNISNADSQDIENYNSTHNIHNHSFITKPTPIPITNKKY